MAQPSFMNGVSFSSVMNDHLLEDTEFKLNYQLGFSIRFYPFKNLPDLSLETEFFYNNKGYRQQLDSTYKFRFSYFSVPVLVRYCVVKDVTVEAGVELSKLFSSNIRKWESTYNDFDTGLILGLTFFEKRMISVYSRVTYGLIPMLDYYSFDKLGNFTGEIHDLRNLNLSLGIKIDLYHEKIF